jgi:hypothetical protein
MPGEVSAAHPSASERSRPATGAWARKGAAGLALLAALAWWLTRPEEGFLVGLVPLSDDEAVLLVRHNGTDASSGVAMRALADGTRRWRTELPAPSDSVGAGDGAAFGRDAGHGRTQASPYRGVTRRDGART